MEYRRSEDNEVFGEMWVTVETKARKVRIAEIERGRAKWKGRKETRRKKTKKETRKEEEKAKKWREQWK